MILTLSVHYSRVSDLIRPDYMLTEPSVPIVSYRDGFGNWCSRLVAPAGKLRISTDTVINDSGAPDTFAVVATSQIRVITQLPGSGDEGQRGSELT